MLEFDDILRRNRALTELLELARAVVADGVVTEQEAEALRYWVEANPDMAGVWPVGIVVNALTRGFASGRMDEHDRDELLSLIRDVAGEGTGSNPEEWGKLHRED